MDKNDLFHLILSSELRRNILYYIEGGPRTLSQLKSHFEIGPSQMSSKIHELLEYDLIAADNKTYRLTTTGKVVLNSYRPFASTVEVIDRFGDYWKSHDMSSLPPEFLSRIGEMHNSWYVEDDIYDMNRTRNLMMEIALKAKYIKGVSSVFDESIVRGLQYIGTKGVPISMVLTETVYQKLQTECPDLVEEISKGDHLTTYVTDCDLRSPFIVTDTHMYFSLYYENGKLDMNSNLVSEDEAAKTWGNDLFEYYQKRSVKRQ